MNLLIGLVLFNYFSEGTTQLTETLLKRANIILKLNFPRIIVIYSSLLSSLINFFASLLFFIILIGIFFRSSVELSVQGILLFGVIIFFLSLLIVGFGLFASIIQVKLRDFLQIWTLALLILFYMTPIIYPITILPTQLQQVMLFNPLTIIVDVARNQLLGVPLTVSAYSIAALGGIIMVIIILGYYFFNSRVKKIAEEI